MIGYSSRLRINRSGGGEGLVSKCWLFYSTSLTLLGYKAFGYLRAPHIFISRRFDNFVLGLSFPPPLIEPLINQVRTGCEPYGKQKGNTIVTLEAEKKIHTLSVVEG